MQDMIVSACRQAAPTTETTACNSSTAYRNYLRECITQLHHDGQRLGRAIANSLPNEFGDDTWKLGRRFTQRKRLLQTAGRDTKHHQQREALIIIVGIPLVAFECEFHHILSFGIRRVCFMADDTLIR